MTGVALSSAYAAVGSFLTLLIDKHKLERLQRWQAGELWGTDWPYILILLLWLLVFGSLAYRKSLSLNVLQLGFDLSIGLGLEVRRAFLGLAFYAVALAAGAVSFGGNFFFLGLIGPHIARKLVGTDARLLLPAAGLVSALLVMAADSLVQNLSVLANIPTGIVISVLSVPYFLYLLIRG